MLVKHMRLTKDVIVNDNNGRKYALGTGVYDVYRGKNSDNTPKFEPVFINLLVNGDREVSFLESFGKKGSLLKITGEITAGKPYQNKTTNEWVSTINLNVRTVDFSEVRVGQSKDGAGSSEPTQNNVAAPPKEELESIDAVFEFWDENTETA